MSNDLQVTFSEIRLAKDVLTLASDAGMPSSVWQTDSRVARACTVLDIDPDFAEQSTEENYDEWTEWHTWWSRLP